VGTKNCQSSAIEGEKRMDLSQLSRIQSKKAKLVQERSQNASAACDLGFQCLANAFQPENRVQSRQLLIQAYDAFQQALEQQRTNPEPYVGLSYLLTSMEQYDNALVYLEEANRLCPSYPNLQAMFRSITEAQQHKAKLRRQQSGAAKVDRSKPPVPPFKPSEPQPIDYDALYDQTLNLIVQRVHKIMGENRLPHHPTLNSKELELLSIQRKNWRKWHKEVQSNLDILDQEIDVSPLQLQLKPFELLLKRYSDFIVASQLLIELKLRIRDESVLVLAQIREGQGVVDPSDVAILQENLESILDQCDKMADQLDQIEALGFDNSMVLADYEKLIRYVEALQEAIDT